MNTPKRKHTRIRPLNPPELAGRLKRRELAGQRPREDQTAYLDRSEVDALESLTDTALGEDELLSGELVASPAAAELPDSENLKLMVDIAPESEAADMDAELQEIDSLELIADSDQDGMLLDIEDRLAQEAAGLDLLTDLELRAGETADPMIASDEAATYVPPIDPPVIPGSAGTPANAEIASGLGVSALDEPYDESHHTSFLPDDDEVSARVREALRADSSTSQYADSIVIDTRDGIVILRGLVDDLIDNDNLLAVASDVTGVAEVVDRLRVRSLGAR